MGKKDDAAVSEPADEFTDTTVRHEDVAAMGEVGELQHGTVTVLSGPNHGALFVIDGDEVSIGRGRSNQICIADEGLSRVHARIARRPDGFYVEDVHSKNGTYLGGAAVCDPRRLTDGERIALGANTVLRFALQDSLERDASRRTIELTIRDPLTGLFNRGHVQDRLAAEFAFAKRHHSALHVMLLDLDHFKRINDTHGHQAGDAVLRSVSDALLSGLRLEDLLGRYGGEEFLIVARGTDGEGVLVLAERLRLSVQEVVVTWEDAPIRVTTSLGIATLGPQHDSVETLIRDADEALYQSKHEGRNRMSLHEG